MPPERLTRNHILQQRLIRMAPLQLCLPNMVMRIDETGRDDLVSAIDRLDIRGNRSREVLADSGDLVTLDQEVGAVQGGDVVVRAVGKNDAVLQEERVGHHTARRKCSRELGRCGMECHGQEQTVWVESYKALVERGISLPFAIPS